MRPGEHNLRCATGPGERRVPPIHLGIDFGTPRRHDHASERDRVSVSWLPHYHDMGLVYGLLQPLYSGFPAVVFPPSVFARTPETWLRTISRLRATHSGGPNFAYDLCVRRIPKGTRDDIDLSSWRVAFNGAEPIRLETIDRFAEEFAPQGFRRGAFFPAYGLAEATLKVTGGFIDRVGVLSGRDRRSVNASFSNIVHGQPIVGCGQPTADTRLLIVNPETATELPRGSVGEIWISGPGVANGYWNRPAETAATFHARTTETNEGPFLRTGDLGVLLDNQLFVTGRLKEVLIVRGQNYYPHDLESVAIGASDALRGHLAAMFAVPDQTAAGRPERVVLAAETDCRIGAELESLADAIRARLASECGVALDVVCFVKPGALPRTSSGKLRRLDASALYVARELALTHESVSTDRLECQETEQPPNHRVEGDGSSLVERLRGLVAAVAQRELTRADDRRALAALGLDSVRVMELAARLESEFGLSLPLSRLMANTTLDDVMGMVARDRVSVGPAGGGSPPENRTDDLVPAAPEQERLWWAASSAPGSSVYNLAVSVRLIGPMNPILWDAAVKCAEARHESLGRAGEYSLRRKAVSYACSMSLANPRKSGTRTRASLSRLK